MTQQAVTGAGAGTSGLRHQPAVLWLACDESRYVTGITLPIDAGRPSSRHWRIAMGSGWFETVAVAQRRAKKVLPKSVYWSVVAGSEQGATLKDNVAATWSKRSRSAPRR